MLWNWGYFEGTWILNLVGYTEFLDVSRWAKFTGPKSSTSDSHIQAGLSGKQGSFSLNMKKKSPILEFLALWVSTRAHTHAHTHRHTCTPRGCAVNFSCKIFILYLGCTVTFALLFKDKVQITSHQIGFMISLWAASHSFKNPVLGLR